MEDYILYNPEETKKKTKTTTYKMKHVFDDGKSSTMPKKEKNKVISKVKKTIS